MDKTSTQIVPQTFPLMEMEGIVQHYAWGGDAFIPQLLKIRNPENKPFAELWMGAHPKAPAQVKINGEPMGLDDFIQLNPFQALGQAIADKFSQRLPYLFKVLDVKQMLSIQVHPTKEEAEKGFQQENEWGIPLTAKHRNYRDDNHKPEIMVALSDFWLLHGFRPVAHIQRLIDNTPEFQVLKPWITTGSLFMLYKHIMELPQVEVNEILRPLIQRIVPLYQENKIPKDHPEFWTARVALNSSLKEGDLDRGIFSIFFFNLCNLKEGEGIFQDAGIPHAYLEGVNIELMANSDNVLRGGLTPKHIDVPELLKHTRFESVEPNVLKGIYTSYTEKVYKSSVDDFELSHIQVTPHRAHQQAFPHSMEILILVEGEVLVTSEQAEFMLSPGGIFVAPADILYQIKANHSASLYKATVPIKQ